jgi:hypothetical protein
MMEVVIEFLKLGVVGLVAGLFASTAANRDYRYRKWWELRVTAYQNLIESLSDLVYYYETHFTALIEDRQLSEVQQKKLQEYWELSFPKVRKFADTGAFLFSTSVNEELAKFIETQYDDTYFEHLDNRLAKAKSCLNLLVESSKKDLKLQFGLMSFFTH